MVNFNCQLDTTKNYLGGASVWIVYTGWHIGIYTGWSVWIYTGWPISVYTGWPDRVYTGWPISISVGGRQWWGAGQVVLIYMM